MVFSSVIFLFRFLPLFFLLYYLVPGRMKNFLLFVGSLFFYAWGEPVYVVLMLFSTLVDYTHGRLLGRFRGRKGAKLILLSSVLINLFILCFFKYADFLTGAVNQAFGLSLPLLSLPLPIGISFYTFQTMSYTIDVYRGEVEVQKNLLDFGVYVTMFPQLIAGPIVKYREVEKRLHHRRFSITEASAGMKRFCIGLAKKVLIANQAGELWVTVSAMELSGMSVLTAWLGVLAFAFQIYFDFSGYSDMAVGLGKMLGFNFPKNFDHPYLSRSVGEFWRRWHITLGTWFREYVYIPLGGNRKGQGKTIRNLLIVWGLTGLWHGASWNFILWGLYFGVLIVIERLGWGNVLKKLPSAVSGLYTFLIVVFGWVLFDTNTLSDAGRFFKAMFGGNGLGDSTAAYYMASNIVIFLLCVFASTDLFGKLTAAFKKKKGKLYAGVTPAVTAAVLLLCTSYLVDATYNPFLYFRF